MCNNNNEGQNTTDIIEIILMMLPNSYYKLVSCRAALPEQSCYTCTVSMKTYTHSEVCTQRCALSGVQSEVCTHKVRMHGKFVGVAYTSLHR